MSVDLHTHTTVSDGALAPAELVNRAARRGLAALAITDHDAIDAIEEAVAAAPPSLRIIAGAELTCRIDGCEAHILAYGIDPADRSFRTILQDLAAERVERARSIVRRINALGIEIEFAEVERVAGQGTIARPHVALALMERGHVSSLNEAFTRFLGRHAPAFVEKRAPPPAEAFRQIRSAGGVPVLAHPGTFRRDDLIPPLVEAGLEGLEVRHSQHSAAQCEHYEAMARTFGLLPSGGSDFHGTPGHRSRLGFPEVPDAWAAALVDRSGSRH